MSFVIAAPEMLISAAIDLSNIGSTLRAAHAAAAVPITGVLAAAEDEVSAAIAAVFSAHGESFEALGAQAAAFQTEFVRALTGAATAYAGVEAPAPPRCNACSATAPWVCPVGLAVRPATRWRSSWMAAAFRYPPRPT